MDTEPQLIMLVANFQHLAKQQPFHLLKLIGFFFQRGEQKLRFRMLKFIIERKMWRSTRVSFVELDDVAQEDDKRYKETNYKLDRQDMFNLEISVRLLATLISSYFLFRSLRLCVIQICG